MYIKKKFIYIYVYIGVNNYIVHYSPIYFTPIYLTNFPLKGVKRELCVESADDTAVRSNILSPLGWRAVHRMYVCDTYSPCTYTYTLPLVKTYMWYIATQTKLISIGKKKKIEMNENNDMWWKTPQLYDIKIVRVSQIVAKANIISGIIHGALELNLSPFTKYIYQPLFHYIYLRSRKCWRQWLIVSRHRHIYPRVRHQRCNQQ